MIGAVERTGIVEEGQRRRELYARPRLVSNYGDSPRPSGIEQLARDAVDAAIREAIQREVERRREEIEMIVRPNGPALNVIMSAVCAATGYTPDDLQTKGRRTRDIAYARWLFWYIAGALRRDLSLPSLGRVMDNDHSTVCNALKLFRSKRFREPLATYCAHPAVSQLLAQAEENPRRTT